MGTELKTLAGTVSHMIQTVTSVRAHAARPRQRTRQWTTFRVNRRPLGGRGLNVKGECRFWIHHGCRCHSARDDGVRLV